MRLFFAGADGSAKYNTILLQNNVCNRLESFYTLGKRPPSSNLFKGHLLDSGGFSARMRGVDIRIGEYINFINMHNVGYAFNLDVLSVEQSQNNQKLLMYYTDAIILPVYHLEEYFDRQYRYLLEEYCNNFEYISIGGVAGVSLTVKQQTAYYDFIFSTIPTMKKIHGLGITKLDVLKKYPWFSVDSTSWLSFARYGTSKSVKDKKMAKSLNNSRHYLYNTEKEVKYWLSIEALVTNIWKLKGVNYEE